MALPKATIRGLRAFLAVYEEQSFSLAAARENATQSGMSTQVKNLETALGAPLLIRGTGKMALTPEGEIVYRHAQIILREMSEVERAVERLGKTVSGTIRVGLIPTLTRAALPDALAAFRAANPDVETIVVEEYSAALMERVSGGDLDWAIVPASEIPEGLTARHIATDREVLAAPRSFRPDLPHMTAIRPADMAGLDLVMPTPVNVRRERLDRYLEMHGVTPGEIVGMDAMLATLELVASGAWASILPAALLAPDIDGGTRKLHPLADPEMTIDYMAVQKAERAESEAARLFLDALREATVALTRRWAARSG